MSNKLATVLILFSTSLMVGSGALWAKDGLNRWQLFCVMQCLVTIPSVCASVGMRQDKERGVKSCSNRRIRG